MKIESVTLGDLLELRASDLVVPNDTYPIAGVYGFGRGILLRDPILGMQTKYQRLTRLRAGDLVMSKLKAFEGAITVAPKGAEGYYVSQEFPVHSLRPPLDPGFLDHLVKSTWFTNELATLSVGIGARRERVHAEQLKRIEIPLPTRAQQDLIVAHLDSLARLGQRTKMPMAPLLERDWGGERYMVGDLLEPVVRVEPVDDSTTYTLSGVKWYGKGLYTRETKTGRDLAAKTVRRIEAGDLVYNRLFAWKQSFAIATEASWASNEFPTFRVKTYQVLPRVLLAALLSPSFTAAVSGASTGSTPTSRNRLKERDFLALEVAIPPMAQQHSLERLLRAADRAEVLNNRATMIADAVLPAARNEIFTELMARATS